MSHSNSWVRGDVGRCMFFCLPVEVEPKERRKARFLRLFQAISGDGPMPNFLMFFFAARNIFFANGFLSAAVVY